MALLERFGWSEFFESRFAPFASLGLLPARVLREERGRLLVVTEDGERAAVAAGRLLHAASSRLDLPAVGDWVGLRPGGGPAIVEAVVPRRNRIVRKAAGEAARPQVLAANVDTLLVAMGLDVDFSPRRLERYVALAWESEALPLVVLTKADACADVDARVAQARGAAPGADVVAVSAVTGEGLAALDAHLEPGRTLALVGMSGVGKSTLVNRLLGTAERPLQSVRDVRASDGRGRHATTRRDLLPLPGGRPPDRHARDARARALGRGRGRGVSGRRLAGGGLPLPRLRPRRGAGLRRACGGRGGSPRGRPARLLREAREGGGVAREAAGRGTRAGREGALEAPGAGSEGPRALEAVGLPVRS